MASPDAGVTGQDDLGPGPSRTHLEFVLIHEHRLFRHGLRLTLEQLSSRYSIIGEMDSVAEAIEQCSGSCSAIVILDMTWSDDANRSAEIGRIKSALPESRILVIAPTGSPVDVVPVIRAGAHAYLTQSSGTQELVRAIEAVESGGSWIDPSLTTMVMDEYRKLSLTGGGRRVERGDLSPRDREMLLLLATGLNNRQIAERTRLAESTVKNNLSSLFRKLNVRDRTQAVLYAIDHGMVPTNHPRD